MIQAEIVKFVDGKFGARIVKTAGYFRTLTKVEYIDEQCFTWDGPRNINRFCKFDTLEDARKAKNAFLLECVVVDENTGDPK